ncbi:MAG: DUF4136 domain-containing protein [Chitinophagaceae bacterium]|nr:DUF4136 domain-containing protein [Chitinophagaceae bacterium]
MKTLLNHLAAPVIAASALLSSCAKDPVKNLTDEESRIYITNYDSTASFGSFKTYSISDSVAVVSDGALKKKSLNETYAVFIQAVKDNMQQRGYQLVDKSAQPDIGINISEVVNSYTGVISYPSYWGYYDAYWDPYYWGYGGYNYYFPYASYAVYSIREGALSIDMVDLKDAGTDKQIKGIWNGLIRGSGIFDSKTAASQVNALFEQSPYIKASAN